jgi:hypothetical protein
LDAAFCHRDDPGLSRAAVVRANGLSALDHKRFIGIEMIAKDRPDLPGPIFEAAMAARLSLDRGDLDPARDSG